MGIRQSRRNPTHRDRAMRMVKNCSINPPKEMIGSGRILLYIIAEVPKEQARISGENEPGDIFVGVNQTICHNIQYSTKKPQ
jgi:hypothetical protein